MKFYNLTFSDIQVENIKQKDRRKHTCVQIKIYRSAFCKQHLQKLYGYNPNHFGQKLTLVG